MHSHIDLHIAASTTLTRDDVLEVSRLTARTLSLAYQTGIWRWVGLSSPF